MSEDYLVHYGILGMRWGVRRFQNYDGSLTSKGRIRYLNADGSRNEKTIKRDLKAQVKAYKKAIAKGDDLWAEQIQRYAKGLGKDLDKETALGLARVNKIIDEAKDNEKEPSASEKKEKSEKAPSNTVPKKMEDMTNSEIDAAIARMEKEKQYVEKAKALKLATTPEPQITKGQEFITRVKKEVLMPVFIDQSKRALNKLGDKALATMLQDAQENKNVNKLLNKAAKDIDSLSDKELKYLVNRTKDSKDILNNITAYKKSSINLAKDFATTDSSTKDTKNTAEDKKKKKK